MNTRIHIIAPVEDQELLNSAMESEGMGPGNLFIPICTGETITHYAASGLFPDREAELIRSLFPETDRCEESCEFDDWLQTKGLSRHTTTLDV